MKTIFTLSATLVLSAAGYAQTYAKPRAIVVDPNSCNNTVVMEIVNNTPLGYVYHTTGIPWMGGTQTLVYDEDTIENVCYNDPVDGTHGFDLFSSNGYLSHSLLYSTIITPDFDYTLSAYTAPTDEDSEDGSFTLDFGGNVTGYDLNIFQDNGHEPTITIVDSNTMTLSDLNVSFITIHIDNPMDATDYAHFRIYAGDPADFYTGDGLLDVAVSYHDAGSTCEGWISIQPTNPIGQTYYYWSDDTYGELGGNTHTRANLCPGTYRIYSQSIQYLGMNSAIAIAAIDTIVISGDSTTYVSPDRFSVEMDWIGYYSETWCWIYEWETLDSIKYSMDTLLYVDSLLIATYDTTRYLGNIAFTIHDSIVTVGDSAVTFDQTIYCDEIIPEEEYMLQNLNWEEVIDNQDYEALLHTTEIEESVQAILYPNPTHGDLNIDFKKVGTYKIQLIDYSGRLIETVYAVNDDHVLISTENMVSGTYLILIHSADGVQQHRFVKGG